MTRRKPIIPVEVGQVRRHPKGHTLRVTRVHNRGYECSVADCTPDPPVPGRRRSTILARALAKWPLVEPQETP